MQLQKRPSSDRVLRPKIHGTLALHEVLADVELDFLVLFSSVSSFLGAPGQADYAAASEFQNAYARAEAGREDRRVLSVLFGAWAEVGMLAEMGEGGGEIVGVCGAAFEEKSEFHAERFSHSCTVGKR